MHGRWSQRLGKYARAYEHAKADDSLLDLKRPIAALDTLVQRHAERLEELDTPGFRQRALEHYREARRAQRSGDVESAAEALNKLGRLLGQGATEDRAMVSLASELDRLARRIEGAWHVKLAKKQAINVRDLTAVFARMVDVARQELDPKDAQRLIARYDRELIVRQLPATSGVPAPGISKGLPRETTQEEMNDG